MSQRNRSASPRSLGARAATHEQTLAFIAEEAKRRCARTVTTCTTAARYNGFPSC
jgi:hypothetical protein